MKTINIKDSFTISKDELKQLKDIKHLLLSEDEETSFLGYKMLVRHSFYRKCNPSTLYIKGNYYTLSYAVKELKECFSYPGWDKLHRINNVFAFFEDLSKLERRPDITIPISIEII